MPFRAILQRVVAAHPQVLGVLFCDEEGELVDMAQPPAAPLDSYELKVLAASCAAWLHTATRIGGCRSQELRLRIRHQRAQILVAGLPEYYYLVAVVGAVAPAALIEHSLQRAAHATRLEM